MKEATFPRAKSLNRGTLNSCEDDQCHTVTVLWKTQFLSKLILNLGEKVSQKSEKATFPVANRKLEEYNIGWRRKLSQC